MYCQSGRMERAVERSGGVGKKVSRYDAGSESNELKTRKYRRVWWKRKEVRRSSATCAEEARSVEITE